jgi:hypothetical protein
MPLRQALKINGSSGQGRRRRLMISAGCFARQFHDARSTNEPRREVPAAVMA